MPRVLYLLMLALCVGALPAAAHEPLLPEDQAQQLGAFFDAIDKAPLETLTIDLGTELDGWNSRLALIPTGELMHLLHAKEAKGLSADRQQAAHRLLAAVRAFRIVQPLGQYASKMAAAMVTEPPALMPLLAGEEPRRVLFDAMTALLAEKSAELRWAVLDAALRIYTFEVPRGTAGFAKAAGAILSTGLEDPDPALRLRLVLAMLDWQVDLTAWPQLIEHEAWARLPWTPESLRRPAHGEQRRYRSYRSLRYRGGRGFRTSGLPEDAAAWRREITARWRESLRVTTRKPDRPLIDIVRAVRVPEDGGILILETPAGEVRLLRRDRHELRLVLPESLSPFGFGTAMRIGKAPGTQMWWNVGWTRHSMGSRPIAAVWLQPARSGSGRGLLRLRLSHWVDTEWTKPEQLPAIPPAWGQSELRRPAGAGGK